MSPLLEVQQLEVGYGEARTLNGISFAIESGSLFAIVGSNGAGKTSLVRSIGVMLRPNAGKILFDGVDTTKFRFERNLRARYRPGCGRPPDFSIAYGGGESPARSGA